MEVEDDDWLSEELDAIEQSRDTVACSGPFLTALLSGTNRECGDVSSNMVGDTAVTDMLVFTTFVGVLFVRGGNTGTFGAKVFFWIAAATRLLLGALVLVMERHKSRSSRRNFSW